MFDLNDISSITPIETIDQYDPRSVFGEKYVFPIHLSLEILDIFCSYVIDLTNDEIPHTALINAKTLFEILDKRPYYNNDSLRARIDFISLALEARIDLNIDKKSLIISHIQRNCESTLIDIIEEEILKGPAKVKLSKDVSKYINTIVFEYLVDGYSVIYNQKLMDLFDKKETGGFKTIAEYSEAFKKLLSEMNSQIQDVERFKREGKGFDLNKNTIIREAKRIRRELTKPSNKLKTGLQYLNKMLNGGFESGRSYLFIGSTGVGKSIVLLSVANWIRQYNKLPKKDGMKQAVLFISQENSQVETFERLFNMNVTSKDIAELSEEEMIQGMIDSGMCVSESGDEINLIFKEYEDKEIGVSDIDNLISDYERQGIEIIAVVQDYIEKLRPRFKYSELRHSLGCCATELAELAKHRKIPVISAAQLNRTANSIISNAIVNNKKNTTKLLGKENISESWDMMKNTDVCILINREIDDTSDVEKQYLGFKLDKFRGKPNKDKVYLFLHPFDEENGILLTPDIDTKPLSRTRMEDFEPMRHPEVSSERVTFTDPTDVSEFRSSFIDIIGDDYKDTSQHYVNIMNKANEVANKMKAMQEREKEIKRQRENEKKTRKYKKTNDNEIIIESRKNPQLGRSEDGRIIIHSRKKRYDYDEDGRIIISKRQK